MLNEKLIEASKLSLLHLGNVVLEQREAKTSACKSCMGQCSCSSGKFETQNANNFYALDVWLPGINN